MKALQEPFRYDYVGSFLRPEKVKNAKALYEDGKIEKEELDETINEAIREVVAKQKDLGFHVITDGEFRRTYWHLDFMWGFEGVAHESTGKFYATDEELIHDIGVAYQDVIRQFYEAGCRNLQLDDCTWGAVVGDAAKQRYKSLGIDLEEVKQSLLAVNNLALEGKPEDMVITSHICRGNYHSTYFTSGPYDSVADYVFAKENVDALFLEYDDERSGGFAPLAKVSPDKKVVLGLITTKTPELEDKKEVIERIHEAAKYIPLDRLCLSPQCGFASCEIGNKLTEEQQWAKLKLVKEIAEEVWG